MIPLVSSAKTSKEAWDQLAKRYTNKSHTRIVYLKDKLSSMTQGSKPVAEFLHGIKALADELAIIGAPQEDVDLLPLWIWT